MRGERRLAREIVNRTSAGLPPGISNGMSCLTRDSITQAGDIPRRVAIYILRVSVHCRNSACMTGGQQEQVLHLDEISREYTGFLLPADSLN